MAAHEIILAFLTGAAGFVTALGTYLKYRADAQTMVRRSDIEGLEEAIAHLREENKWLMTRVRELEEENEGLRRKMVELEKKNEALQRRVEVLEEENSRLEAENRKLRSRR